MKSLTKLFGLLIFVTLILSFAPPSFSQPFPPNQPESGPGGRDYKHDGFYYNYYQFGPKAQGFWIFEPFFPTPTAAPVVVLLHGWLAIDPYTYSGWISHLVLRGNVVIYPVYQDWWTLPDAALENAIEGIKDSLQELKRPGHVPTDSTLFAITGHSLGGYLSAMIADQAIIKGLPAPKVVMPIEPGVELSSIPEQLSGIPQTALMVVVQGEDDTIVDPELAKKIWQRIQHLPEENRDFIRYRTDRNGNPPLIADHFFPVSTVKNMKSLNALEFFGIWKIFDALINASFYGTDREFALGNTPQQRWMGEWSDGVPVLEPVVTHNP